MNGSKTIHPRRFTPTTAGSSFAFFELTSYDKTANYKIEIFFIKINI